MREHATHRFETSAVENADLRLDRASGIELVAALRGISASAPILLMTGFVSNELRDLAQIFGVEILDKPFAAETLRDTVKGPMRAILAA